MTLCEFCDRRAVAVSSSGSPLSRQARCSQHRVLGGDEWAATSPHITRKANAWIRDPSLSVEDVIDLLGHEVEDDREVHPCKMCGGGGTIYSTKKVAHWSGKECPRCDGTGCEP